ncbi:MAG: DUF4276 family protein [Phycisphaerae bacterium]|nr:DUF4276 family protein [Phycisphaerae bacterium]
METLLRRLTGPKLEMKLDRLANNNIHLHHGRGQGYYKKAVRWLLEAEKRGCAALILLVDNDRSPGRSAEIDRAQSQIEISTIPRAMAVAVEAFDAWIFADEKALSKAVGHAVQTQPHPEKVDHPKKHLETLLQQLDRSPSAELYSQVAQMIDLSVLEKRCPRGFAGFAQRVRAIAPRRPTGWQVGVSP